MHRVESSKSDLVVSHHPWRTRNLKVLTAVSFTQDAASELLYPLLPIFLTSTLGAPPVAVGAIEGTANGVSAVTKMVAGRISDRFARRPLIAWGYGLAAIGKVVVVMALAWPLVLLGRVVDRLGKGMRSAPRDALLVEGVAPIVGASWAFTEPVTPSVLFSVRCWDWLHSPGSMAIFGLRSGLRSFLPCSRWLWFFSSETHVPSA